MFFIHYCTCFLQCCLRNNIYRLLVLTFDQLMDTLLSSFSLYSLFLQTHLQTHHNRNNLKVQDRQNRVCTTIAIAIVAETCSPFTVLPALMNEYRVPDLNVQNGVLKALSFLFEYIGPMGELLVVVGCCWLLLVVVIIFFFF